MKELDRILGILLALQSRRTVRARQLAEQFAVSTRTIYRDLQTMSLLGIPIYAERGRNGGIRLLEGFFLPPLMFTQGEAVALLLGLKLLRSLRVVPFQGDVDTVSHKLLAAVPDHLRMTLARLDRVLGVERSHPDLFHPEPDGSPDTLPAPDDIQRESAIVTRFLQAKLAHAAIRLSYRSPYRDTPSVTDAHPLGLFLDRGRWYLVGETHASTSRRRIWRTDRVIALDAVEPVTRTEHMDAADFDVSDLLGHAWLESAMRTWRHNAPVRLRITQEQARRLRHDWYYRFAQYDDAEDGSVVMSIGESDPELVLPLLRWLGPGAVLLSPKPWRDILRDQLDAMQHQLRHATLPSSLSSHEQPPGHAAKDQRL